MPFSPSTPHTFSTVAIQRFAPAMSGVYGISNANEWIYIRDTDNIQEALLAHFEEVDTILRAKRPTGFVFEMCDRARRAGRQDRLIHEYQPSCNQQLAGRP